MLGGVASSRNFIKQGCYLFFHTHLTLFPRGSASLVLSTDHCAAAGTAAASANKGSSSLAAKAIKGKSQRRILGEEVRHHGA